MLTTAFRRSTKLVSQPNRGFFRAALLLAGNGVYDGSETTEACSALIALGKHKAQIQCFAPNEDQFHVVNHTTGEEMDEKRNVLVESARIARGDVKDIKDLNASDFDAIFVPGGFGAAKNLSDFAVKGAEMSVHPEVERVLKDFHGADKHIGLCCISPIIAAKVFGNARLTLGCKGDEASWPYAGSIDAAASFGNKMVEQNIREVCWDETNKIATSPAYMFGTASPDQVYESVKGMVDKVAHEIGKKTQDYPLSLLVSVEIQPTRIEEFLKAIKEDARGSRLEEGCFRFDVLQDPVQTNKFHFYEVYKDNAALKIHREQDHFKAWGDFKARGGVIHQDVKILNAIDFTF